MHSAYLIRPVLKYAKLVVVDVFKSKALCINLFSLS